MSYKGQRICVVAEPSDRDQEEQVMMRSIGQTKRLESEKKMRRNSE
jgi:hypothetical protein